MPTEFHRMSVCLPAVWAVALGLVGSLHSGEWQRAMEGPVAPADRPYDRLDAGADAHALHENRRRLELQQQSAWNEQGMWWAGYRPTPAIVPAPSWDPFWPGNAWSYRFPPFAPQPVARQHVELSGRQWESHPLYVDPLSGQLVRLSELFGTSTPSHEAPPPPPPVSGGPREF